MWYSDSVIYQIYPLGLCGAPEENDGCLSHRILRLKDFTEHIKALGADTVLLNPLFESDRHGYDTRDFFRVDCRLGTGEDLKEVCRGFHEAGIRVIFDGVFNHVGRGFWAFQDVREKGLQSQYRDWFNIWEGNTFYNDGFCYEGWEGHLELPRLNLKNAAVADHIFSAIASWVEDYDIDGLRLDVAYCLDRDFLRRLRSFTDGLKPEFLLVGEMIHGNYNDIVNDEMCHSATNYECCKGLWSSFNSMNMFEIAHSLQRQFGREPWCLYRGKQLLSFLDNHDLERIATRLSKKEHLKPAYGLLFAMPGTPSVYYGSEWGAEGRKSDGDRALRPEFEAPVENELSAFISRLAKVRRSSPALCRGDFEVLHLTNRQLVFSRQFEGKRVIAAVNADSVSYFAPFNAGADSAQELISGNTVSLEGGALLPPFSTSYWETGVK